MILLFYSDSDFSYKPVKTVTEMMNPYCTWFSLVQTLNLQSHFYIKIKSDTSRFQILSKN